MPRLLLLLGYTVLIAFFVALFVLRKEVRRLGLSGSEKAAVSSPTPSRVSPSTPQGKTQERKEKMPPVAEASTRERKGITPSETAVRKETLPSVSEESIRPQKETSPSAEEITQDEKNRLDDILKAEENE